MSHDLSEQDVRDLNPIDIRWYAEDHGWEHKPTRNTQVILLEHPTHKLRQILLPTNAVKDKNLRMLAEAVAILAQDARRSPRAMVKDLLLPPADIVEVGLRSKAVESGTIGLATGLQLMQRARDMLLAAATSAHSAAPFFPRQSYKPALEFLKTCRLGQTERGSYIATVHAPIPAMPRGLFDDHEEDMQTAPFARKTTMMLMLGAGAIRKVLDQATPERIINHVGDGVSANLCDALTDLEIDDQQAVLQIGMRWSRNRRRVANTVPSQVSFRRSEFPYIVAAGQKLRAQQIRQRQRVDGKIINLHAEPANLLDPIQGIVTVRALIDSEKALVSLALPAAEYQKACNAHRDRRDIAATGVLQRDAKAKKYKLTEIREFQVLPPVSSE